MKKLIKKFIFLNVIIVIFSIELFSQSLGNFKEFNKGELYFVPPVDSELVNKLGNYLIETGFLDRKSVV